MGWLVAMRLRLWLKFWEMSFLESLAAHLLLCRSSLAALIESGFHFLLLAGGMQGCFADGRGCFPTG
jgi:hypothetical protein